MMTQQLDQQFIASTYGRFPIALVKGQGALLTDENGKSYIDMGSGIAVNTLAPAIPYGWRPLRSSCIPWGIPPTYTIRSPDAPGTDALPAYGNEEGVLQQFRRGSKRMRLKGCQEMGRGARRPACNRNA